MLASGSMSALFENIRHVFLGEEGGTSKHKI
jgi:hypothetical protein